MIYQFDSRIRYSEVNSRRELSLGGMINYFQDCSLFHSEAVGLGLEHLKEKGRAWLLSAWQVEIRRRPRFGEKITAQTWAYDFQSFYGYRNFSLSGEQGERMVTANTIWVYIDTGTGHPARIDGEELAGYTLEERLPMDYAPRKIALPGNVEEREAFAVRSHYLDTNGHVNNGQYVELAQDYLPEGFEPGSMRAEYKMQARLGDAVIPWTHREGDVFTVALCSPEKKPYAVVEFKK